MKYDTLLLVFSHLHMISFTFQFQEIVSPLGFRINLFRSRITFGIRPLKLRFSRLRRAREACVPSERDLDVTSFDNTHTQIGE